MALALILKRGKGNPVEDSGPVPELDTTEDAGYLFRLNEDLEDDRETDKISEHDYMQLKNRLTAQAIETMKKLDHERESRQP